MQGFTGRVFALATAVLATGFGASLGLAGCSQGSTSAPAAPSPTPTPAVVAVTVSGPAQVRLGTTAQFTATVTGSTNQAVTWQVDGVTGGSTADGTISATGLYSPPSAITGTGSETISAISQASSTASSSVTASIANPVPILTSATASVTATAQSFLFDAIGTGFVQGALLQVNGASATTTFVSPTELQATATVLSGTSSVTLDVLNPSPGPLASADLAVAVAASQTTVAAAARLLDQATFGPTTADIQNVQTIGLDPYITQQFATAQTVLPDLPNPLPTQCAPSNPKPCEQSEWWSAVMTGPDQLRQRVAFALSEMFVVSTNSVSPYSIIPFHNLLAADAFSNFSTIMKDVSLSTAMGAYLNMLNSAKPATGQIANENYPRELMQLFTIGLDQLNSDGSLQLDASGNPIPTFTELQVQAFARAYTGWTYASSTGGVPAKFPNGTANYDSPMAAVASAHDTTAKILLGGTTLPAGQTAAQDLDGALANIFAQPNTAPFVCRQLIQHLVASNPSAAYVGRVSAVFNSNAAGTRGDMKSVIKAILEDPEARAGDTNTAQNGGHLREPILYLSAVMRGLGYTNTSAGYYGTLSNYSGNLSEAPYASPSVFNFFPPEYVIPGTSVNAPEFDLENTASAVLRLTQANQLVYGQISGFTVDLSATSALGMAATSSPANLVDALGVIFMHGQMPANMRSAIINHISTLTNVPEQVRVATYLVITSSQYKTMH
jgi:uncharacterized protein (DUF1800 family)